ncbi:MAG: hypothetical protein R3F15_19960 [Lysobacterales bacterium]
MKTLNAMARQVWSAALATLIALPAGAATINVNSLLDSGSTSDGLCTLREAVLAADLNLAIDTCAAGSNTAADLIVLSPSLFPPPLQLGVISLTDSLNIIDTSLTIQVPASASLSLIGNGTDPVLTLDQDLGASFSLNNTLIRDGFNSDDGGGIAILGGTRTVNLTRVTLTNNQSDGHGGGLGISSSDRLTLNLDQVTISSNDADEGGGIGALLGEDLTVNLIDSTLSSNTSSTNGGGLFLSTPVTVSNVQAVVNIERTRFIDNMSAGNGGALMLVRGNQGSNRSTTVIVDSSFVGNQALGTGGALVAFGLRSDSVSSIELRRNSFVENSSGAGAGAVSVSVLRTTAINNTVIGNIGGSTGGAGFSFLNAETPYEVSLIGNSFSNNVGGTNTASSAAWDMSVIWPGLSGSTIRYVGNVFNSAVDNPGDSPCRLGTVPTAAAFLGGHNRVVDTHLAGNCVTVASDLILPDLGLAVLPVSDPIHTQAALPQPGSPLIDSWPNVACNAETALPLEVHMLGQRRIAGTPINGDPRTAPACDAGAIEAPAGALLSVLLAGSGTGTVISDPVGIDCGVVCEAVYPVDSLISLSAGSAPGSVFSGWSGACSGTGPCTVTLDQARTVTAQFDLMPESFTVAVSLTGAGGGQVSSMPGGILCQPSCSAGFLEGTVVTLQANPMAGSQFNIWGGDCAAAGSNPSCQVTVNSDLTISADFGLSPLALGVAITGSGSGQVLSDPAGIDCPGDCDHDFAAGIEVTLTATAAPGSVFSGWNADCSGTGTCVLTMDQMHSVGAAFDVAVDPLFANGFE